jgi:hypothetical protein
MRRGNRRGAWGLYEWALAGDASAELDDDQFPFAGARRKRGQRARKRPRHLKISLGADDFDADGAGLLVELLDLHRDARRARMSETVARNFLG